MFLLLVLGAVVAFAAVLRARAPAATATLPAADLNASPAAAAPAVPAAEVAQPAPPEPQVPAADTASAQAGANAASSAVPLPARATGPARAKSAIPAAANKLALPAPAAAPLATGVLQLAISPWGQVEVDGQAAGTTPPLTRITLDEGAHTITLRNEDYPPHTITVQVSADKPVTVRHRFGQ
jgi:serine/threonine-protein kinase